MSRARRNSRINKGVWKLVAGGAFGASAALAIAEGASEDARPSLGSLALTSGLAVALLAEGAVALNTDSVEEERYRRWTSLNVKDRAAIVRFEGELAADAAEARHSKTYLGALWIGMAASGATMLALTPLSHYAKGNDEVFYSAGAILLIVGTWQMIASFTGETWHERAYRLYQERRPYEPATRLSLAPSLAAHGGSLTLSGTF
jgi:hypothetical protein